MSQSLLPQNLIEQLDNVPEDGMGYHEVDIVLTNGDVIPGVVVYNSSWVNFEISGEDIESIQIKDKTLNNGEKESS